MKSAFDNSSDYKQYQVCPENPPYFTNTIFRVSLKVPALRR